ncbi:MAG: hypothetical protein ACRELY_05735 [Polyangiaceae bacterium]
MDARISIKWLFLSAISIAWPRAAWAQPPPPHREHVRFSYSAPDGCPSEDEFIARVRDRSAELIDDPEAARSLAVTIAHGDTWHGELRTEGIASGKGSREIDGDSCATIVKSLAIFTAIALREGSPDELPPAHPELQKRDAPDPDEGFLPIAAPPKLEPVLPDLHDGRFAVTMKESLSVTTEGGRAYGTGLDVDYFLAGWFAIGAEGALMLDLPRDHGAGDANETRARFLGHFEFETVQAKGSMFGPHRHRVFDQFITLGAGAIFTRPLPEENNLVPDNPYSADFLFDFATGFRFFVTEDVAFSVQADFMAYQQPDPCKDVDYSTGLPSPIYCDKSLAASWVFQLGLTWLPSRARTRE